MLKWQDKALQFFRDLLIYLFLDRGKGGRKKKRETSMCGCLSHTHTRDLAYNPGMCPDWELNWWPFGSQASTQSTEPHQPGLTVIFKSPGTCFKIYLCVCVCVYIYIHTHTQIYIILNSFCLLLIYRNCFVFVYNPKDS